MSQDVKHPSKTKVIYEAERVLKGDGYFVFRRTQPHALFHVIAFSFNEVKMVQVLRLKKFNFKEINRELCKVQQFIEQEQAPKENLKCELWVWLNDKGWVKYNVHLDGSFEKFEDCGDHHFRKKNNKDV